MNLAPVFTALWLVNHLTADGSTAIGTVVLSHPQCDVLIVLSRGAYSVLAEQTRLYIPEGDAVSGEFARLGVHPFEVVGVMPIDMEVTAAGVPLDRAADLFHERCDR